MADSILVDTDVLIDFLRGNKMAISLIHEHSSKIIISSICVAELYAGVKGDKEFQILEDFISLFRVIPISQKLAKTGGLYKRDFGKSHGVGLADAIIAATADAEDAELKTLNIKHYPMFDKLKPAYKK